MGTRRKAAKDKVIKQDTGSARGRSPHVNASQSLKGCFLELLRPDYRPLSHILPSKNNSEDEFALNWGDLFFSCLTQCKFVLKWDVKFGRPPSRTSEDKEQLRGPESVVFMSTQKVSPSVTLSLLLIEERLIFFHSSA